MIGSVLIRGVFRHCKDLFRTQLTLRGRPISDSVGYEDEQVNYRDRTAAATYGAWNPGLESELPREYLPLVTIFRAETFRPARPRRASCATIAVCRLTSSSRFAPSG